MKFLFIWLICAALSIIVGQVFHLTPSPAFFVGIGFGVLAWIVCEISQ